MHEDCLTPSDDVHCASTPCPSCFLRVLRHHAWLLSPQTSNCTVLPVCVCSTKNCTERKRVFKYRPRRFRLISECFAENDRSWPVLRQASSPHDHTATETCLGCVQLRELRRHLFQPLLDRWSRHSFRVFQSLSVYIPIQKSHFLGVAATAPRIARNLIV